jgi:hypothetical protein
MIGSDCAVIGDARASAPSSMCWPSLPAPLTGDDRSTTSCARPPASPVIVADVTSPTLIGVNAYEETDTRRSNGGCGAALPSARRDGAVACGWRASDSRTPTACTTNPGGVSHFTDTWSSRRPPSRTTLNAAPRGDGVVRHSKASVNGSHPQPVLRGTPVSGRARHLNVYLCQVQVSVRANP